MLGRLLDWAFRVTGTPRNRAEARVVLNDPGRGLVIEDNGSNIAIVLDGEPRFGVWLGNEDCDDPTLSIWTGSDINPDAADADNVSIHLGRIDLNGTAGSVAKAIWNELNDGV